MFIIGITGGIGCGKSTVADICRKAGVPVIDADELSRTATAPGGVAIDELREQFGDRVISADGGLDRKVMAGLAFKNHRALDQLSAIVHRHVVDMMQEQVEKLTRLKTRACVLDVPIPVKNGFLDVCDQVWVVWASDETRVERLHRRGMDDDEARRRMRMQMTREEYTALADHVIENDGDLDRLERIVFELLEDELGQRGIRLNETVRPES